MKARNLITGLFLVVMLPARAEEPSANTRLSAPSDPTAIMQANPYRVNLQDALTQKPQSSALKLANSDFVISGPLIQQLRPNRYGAKNPPLWKRIALLPVSLITPLKMPWPPGGGRYIKWSEHSTRPWMSVSEGNTGNDSMNFIDHEPKNGIISIGK